MTFDEAFERLGRSKFRSRFRLTAADWVYIERVGMETVECHAADFVRAKLSAAVPANDGRQTPMRGHPVFKAMHATACCCRGCMEKWWRVRRGVPLSDAQQTKTVNLILEWIKRRRSHTPPSRKNPAKDAPHMTREKAVWPLSGGVLRTHVQRPCLDLAHPLTRGIVQLPLFCG